MSGPLPTLSVVIPTRDRPDVLRRCLEALELQTSTGFEVIVCDDGSAQDIRAALMTRRWRFPLQVYRQVPSGPGPARNLGIVAARGRLILFLNDDGIPHPDLIARHLEVHRERAGSPIAVLGAFPYSEHARRSAFVRYIERGGYTFHYPMMTAGQSYDFRFFWTCNISVARDHLVAVDGFDPAFDDAMSEDIEIGWRLERDCSTSVLYRPDAECVHEHRLDVDGFVRRQTSFGRNHYRLFLKYGNPSVLVTDVHASFDGSYFERQKVRAAAMRREYDEAVAFLRELDVDRPDDPIDDRTFRILANRVTVRAFINGMLAERERRGDAGELLSVPTGKDFPEEAPQPV